MDGDSPNVGTSDDDNNDVSRCHAAGWLFWGVRTLESRIPMLLSSDPLGMSTAQRKSVSHFYSVGGGGMVASLLLAAEAHTAKGNVRDKESEEDNDGSSSSSGGKR